MLVSPQGDVYWEPLHVTHADLRSAFLIVQHGEDGAFFVERDASGEVPRGIKKGQVLDLVIEHLRLARTP